MNKISKLLLSVPISLAAITLVAAPSLAGTFATKVEYYNQGKFNFNNATKTAARSNTDNVLGAPQADGTKDFLSLGVGGWGIFSFDTWFSGDITLWETTWGFKNKQSDYDEQVEVYVGTDLDFAAGDLASTLGSGNWFDVGRVKNIADGAYDTNQKDGVAGSGATINIGNSNLYKYILLVDKSADLKDRDGFDVNAISVNPATPTSVPEPASVLGLLTLGGLGAGSLLKRKA
ncbi:MAG: PEP-CTERM sorting domain-containing protein [Oscillatoriales cyanobacterium RM2_1_1]|nr:PEP-CTERM sorting domain-containing protein [Oscillatoriales cyanobacterium SM2_3_0]NJO44218.1 PEP-CTERM sorting domain-containing protein [Oscillatoriales cyanobacterium RM2_1_1]